LRRRNIRKALTKEKEKVLTTAMQDIGEVVGNISHKNNFLKVQKLQPEGNKKEIKERLR
jgi:hypothetical protein